ncbi:related to Ribonuclease H [Sporisorium reilianum f. sp. reilianum]|uniref:Ribonuclease H n=1 Tax=Sporisorium reilianum f. sp. reilianum TaxID=72559 RepID=A0A2N8UBD2_9BASI|nr:related to Ribonuclease H [Sporisorium reilianum f. sp. reilianum]
MDKAGKGGYYAVQKGRQQGIFRTWAECEAATKGFAGAVFKKFDTQDAAQAFVKGNGYGGSSSSSSASGSTSAASDNCRPSYHPYATTSSSKASAKRGDKYASAPASVLGKRASHAEHASAKRLHVNSPFPPAPSSSTSASGSQRKSVVYCDGSSIGNGKSNARAGWGVFFEDPDLHHLNESRRLPGAAQTNNRAELMAIIRAIQLCPDDGRQLLILSDSRYSMDAVTKWLPGWRARGFKTATGADVQNQDLIMMLDDAMEKRVPRPTLEYVKAHSGIDGNEIVDRMAKYGASLPLEDSRDLATRSTAPESHVKHVDLAGITINVSVTPAKTSAQMGLL